MKSSHHATFAGLLVLTTCSALPAQELVQVQTDATGSIVTPTNFTASNVDAGMVFGQEYLSWFHSRIMAGATPRVIFSGDSTTHGSGIIADPQRSRLDQAFKTIGLASLDAIECINAGHPGAEVSHWTTNYLAIDLAQQPDLYVLRWGLNPNAAGSFEVDLRAGLQALRNAYSLERLSVVLMTPNAANDSPNHRDRAHLDAINPAIRRAARDFKCVFIDIARLFPDAPADPVMMDDPFGDGRRVHPRDVFNQAIASALADVVLPRGVTTFGAARFQNLAAAELRHDANATPVSFPEGITMERAYASLGWPLDGAIVTERQADGFWVQRNSASSQSSVRTRTGSASGWNLWGDAIVVNPAAAEATLAETNAPASMPSGVSVWPAPAERGWPASGQVTAIKQASGTCLQIHSDAAGGVAVRTSTADNRWTRWSPLGVGGAGLGTPVSFAGPSAGTGAAIEISGTDSNGTITCTTGDAPLAAAEVLTLFWGTAWPSDPHPVISAANRAAAALTGPQQVFLENATRTNAVISAGTMALAPRTTYAWNWMVGQGAAVSDALRVASLRLTARVANDGGFDLMVVGIAGRSCVIEASEDVVRWAQIGQLELGAIPSRFAAASPAFQGQRFFRARLR